MEGDLKEKELSMHKVRKHHFTSEALEKQRDYSRKEVCVLGTDAPPN